MARELVPFERFRLWYEDRAVGAGATLFAASGMATSPVFKCHGHRRVVGNFHDLVAPAAGFPRLLQSHDNFTTTDLIIVIGQDFTQADFQFPFDINIVYPFVRLELTQGAGAGRVILSADAFPE